ncbi:MAG TPA: ABC transporter permease, partial [Gaiellaceae bacterium]|nr:ABC transporter permease [Gaiellaceae bacterium]
MTFLVRRSIGAVLVCLAVTFIVFLIFIVVPGGGRLGTAERIAGKNATTQNVINIEHQWGFDKPIYVQYYRLMKKMFTGNLVSYTSQQNVVSQIWQGLPITLSLSIGAGIIWLFFGIVVGVISGVTAGRLSDRLITVLALIGISMPVFWLGIITRYYLAEGGITSFFPDGEYVGLTSNPLGWFSHLILPWLVLAVLFIGFYGRVLRGNILDTINEDYVRTAKAKGLSSRQILIKHVLRTSLIPVVTLFGLDFAGVLGGGAILTETVFDLHGV